MKKEDQVTLVETGTQKNTGPICIKPYFNPEIQNMGLEKYEMVVFEGIIHEEPITLIDRNGLRYYVTGLNEFAPEVKAIKNEEEKQAKIKDIRKTVSQLERELNHNVVEPDDPEFWNKIILLRPNNDDFWSKITIRCGNQSVYLNPEVDPIDLIKLRAIEAGGFSIVAKSYDAARKMSTPPKFYLDKFIDTVQVKTEVTKLKNKALAELQKLYDKNMNKLLYVAKVVDVNSVEYKKRTPNDVVYDNMDKFINGKGGEKSIARAAESFLNAAALDMESLKIKAMVRDATYYKIMALKSDGFIYHIKSATMMGKTIQDCIEFLKNPLNDKILLDVTNECENYWNA